MKKISPAKAALSFSQRGQSLKETVRNKTPQKLQNIAYGAGQAIKYTAAGIGIVCAGVLLFAFFFALGTAVTAFIVALAWNWCGLHSVFNQPELSFWHVVAVAVVINLLRNIISGNRLGERQIIVRNR